MLVTRDAHSVHDYLPRRPPCQRPPLGMPNSTSFGYAIAQNQVLGRAIFLPPAADERTNEKHGTRGLHHGRSPKLQITSTLPEGQLIAIRVWQPKRSSITPEPTLAQLQGQSKIFVGFTMSSKYQPPLALLQPATELALGNS